VVLLLSFAALGSIVVSLTCTEYHLGTFIEMSKLLPMAIANIINRIISLLLFDPAIPLYLINLYRAF